LYFFPFILADRTNGCTYVSVASVCLSVVCDVCIVAKWSILEQKLLLTAYRKSYNYQESTGIKMNDIDLCIGIV